MARVFVTHLTGLPLMGPPFRGSPPPIPPSNKAHIPLERGGAAAAVVRSSRPLEPVAGEGEDVVAMVGRGKDE